MNVIDTVGPAAWRAALELGAARASRAVLRWLATRRAEQALAELDARVLRDIGASPRLQASAAARRQMQHDERAALHLGIASGAWRHW